MSGIAETFEDALLKGLIAAGYDLKKEGGVLISVRDTDKQEIINIADKFAQMGFELYGTSGTASMLNKNMIATNLVKRFPQMKNLTYCPCLKAERYICYFDL